MRDDPETSTTFRISPRSNLSMLNIDKHLFLSLCDTKVEARETHGVSFETVFAMEQPNVVLTGLNEVPKRNHTFIIKRAIKRCRYAQSLAVR